MTTRIVTDANGRKHITNEPLLHPPQRTWVGLTDDEIDYIYVEHAGDGGPTAICEQFAKAYEAKLKEKNT